MRLLPSILGLTCACTLACGHGGDTVIGRSTTPTVTTVPNEFDDADPSALTLFDRELAPYGGWSDDEVAGTVWIPHPSEAGTDFVPYASHGHFTYREGKAADWIWVSDVAWGWVTSHYGRWTYLAKRSTWAWVPGRRYAGSWITFRVGKECGKTDAECIVGWGPKAPHIAWRGEEAVRRPAKTSLFVYRARQGSVRRRALVAAAPRRRSDEGCGPSSGNQRRAPGEEPGPRHDSAAAHLRRRAPQGAPLRNARQRQRDGRRAGPRPLHLQHVRHRRPQVRRASQLEPNGSMPSRGFLQCAFILLAAGCKPSSEPSVMNGPKDAAAVDLGVDYDVWGSTDGGPRRRAGHGAGRLRRGGFGPSCERRSQNAPRAHRVHLRFDENARGRRSLPFRRASVRSVLSRPRTRKPRIHRRTRGPVRCRLRLPAPARRGRPALTRFVLARAQFVGGVTQPVSAPFESWSVERNTVA